MKTFIINQIAKQFRNKLANAKNVQVKHLTYMYDYNFCKLLNSLVKSYSPKCNHYNDRFIK